MFFSRPALVVYKNSGGKRWHGRLDSLPPLTKHMERNRRQSNEQTLKNVSVLKMAAAWEPPVPTRLYKPLNYWRIMWMRKKLEQAKGVLGWNSSQAKLPPPRNFAASLTAENVLEKAQEPSVAFETRVLVLAERLKAQRQLLADK